MRSVFSLQISLLYDFHRRFGAARAVRDLDGERAALARAGDQQGFAVVGVRIRIEIALLIERAGRAERFERAARHLGKTD